MAALYTSSVLYTLVFDILMFRNKAIAEKKSHPETSVSRKYSLIVSGFSLIYFCLHALLIGLVMSERLARSSTVRWVFMTILDVGLLILDSSLTAIYVITLLR